MSGGLEIPARAYTAGTRAFSGATNYAGEEADIAEAIINATAPIIVAEAFRKRAHEVEVRAVRVRGNNPATVTESLIAQAQQLRDDADVLDPPAVSL